MGGGFGGHVGGFGRIGGLGGAHIGGLGHFGGAGAALPRGAVGHHFAQARGHFGHAGRFRGRRFVPGFYDYDYGCNYGYPYSTPSYSCYPPSYY
jgi:hypothetical protein